MSDSHRIQFTGKNIVKSASTPNVINKSMKDPKDMIKNYLDKEDPNKIIT